MTVCPSIAAALLLTGAPSATAESMTPADSAALANFDLDEIVVTGVRTPKLLKDTPVQTRLISRKDIEKSDATNIQDLLQQELPGVEFSYAMNQQTHLNLNGQGGQSVLFLVDGERLAGETMDDVDFSRLDMNNVDHIEIVKGASSALYGSNAGGGVVNIITRSAQKKWRLTADARLARHFEQRYNIGFTFKSKYVSNILSGSRYSIRNYDVHSAPNPVTRVVTTIYGSQIWNVSDKLTVTPIEGLKITARAGYFFRQLARVADSPERYRDYTAGLKAEWDISPADFLSISYSYDQYDKSDFFRIPDLDVRSYSDVQNSVRALYTHTFGWGDILTAGADFLRDFMHNTKLQHGDRTQNSFDFFAQYDWIPTEKWEVVGALRYDRFAEGDLSRLTPKLSARFRPIDEINIRLGYGMGFRAPTLKEKYYQFDMAGIWIVNGNPSLKPESSHNFNLSAEWNKGCYSVTVSGYYNNIHNKIATGVPYYRPDDATQLYLDYVNLSRFSVSGAEVALRARWTNGFAANVTYAFTNERLGKDKDGNTVNNQYIPARKHSLTARADWYHDFSKSYSLRVGINGRALSGISNVEYKDYYDISAGTVTVKYPPYTIWKLSVSQQFGRHVTLNLALDNLFNYRPKYYYLNCPLTDGINFQAGVSIDLF